MDKKKTPKLVNLERGILLRLAVYNPVRGDRKGYSPLYSVADDIQGAGIVDYSLIPSSDFRACYEALTFNGFMDHHAANAKLTRYMIESVKTVQHYLRGQCGR